MPDERTLRKAREAQVFTPPEVVDFIIHSIEDRLRAEHGHGFESPRVRILDPWGGDGRFLARLIKSGLLGAGLDHHYGRMLTFEIDPVLAAEAKRNIEAAYFEATGRHREFKGVHCLDTFTPEADAVLAAHGWPAPSRGSESLL